MVELFKKGAGLGLGYSYLSAGCGVRAEEPTGIESYRLALVLCQGYKVLPIIIEVRSTRDTSTFLSQR